MNYPKWIRKFLSESEIVEVEESVKRAEMKTSGEIVPVIVSKSSDTYWIPMVLTLLMLLIFYGVDGFTTLDHEIQLRVSHSIATAGAYLILILLTGLFCGISILLGRCACVQRFLVPKQIQQQEVERRAFFEFYFNHVSNTQYQTGILIFISLMERKTVVLGDRHISSKLAPETWDEIVQTIVSSVKAGKTAEGLKSAIAKCGTILQEHFPEREKNPDELPNHLVIKE